MSTNITTIDPRAAARARVGGRYDVRVLEPSPPTVHSGPWFADDPVAAEPRAGALPVLGPVPGPGIDLTWDALARREPDLAPWCADRWLGAWRRLPALPAIDRYTAGRLALHSLAADVVSPARVAANGKIGLRYTHGGFGTPFFGADEQVRVERVNLVVIRGNDVTRTPLSSIERETVGFLGDWYGFAASVLEVLRVESAAGPETPSRVQLWPEHFDLSVDLGDDTAGTRGTFGASPGDDDHPEPYLYVTHWAQPVPPYELWNDTAFGGASLPLAALVAADDQRGRALEFFRLARRVLHGRDD